MITLYMVIGISFTYFLEKIWELCKEDLERIFNELDC